MADVEKKEIIIDINVPYKDAVNGIVKLQDEIEKLRLERSRWAADLKDSSISDEGIKKAQKQVELYDAEIRQLKKTQKEYRTEIDANLQKEEANAGSLKEMRAQLKLLIKEYDALSQTDREQVGGIGEKKLLEIRQLQEELKQAEEASGRFQRSVGSYEDAIKKALAGTMPMKAAMREIKTEIQTVEFQYRQMGDTIQERTKQLAELGQTVGVDTQDYKQQAAELENLKRQYDETGATLDKMKQSAGQMDDAMKDASQSIANFGKDNANLKALTDGAQLLLNSYTALKAGMTALGIESEELYNVFSKIQILQQGLNAINQIANMLEEQSILRQQAKVLWTKLTTTSIATLIGAKKADAAASVEAAAGDASLAAGEVAATAAAGGLTVALKAVGAAIKSIPIIGWIAAATAALAGLVALVVKARKASKENNDTLKDKLALQKQSLDLEKQALSSVKEQEVQLRASVGRLKECKEGTEEWKREIANVASALGVDAEWLEKNKDKVDKLTEAWVNMKVAMAKGEAYAKQIADNEIKIQQAKVKIENILASEGNTKKRIALLQQELGMNYKIAKKLSDTYHNMKQSGGTYITIREYNNAVNEYTDSLKKQNETLHDGLEDAYKDVNDNQEVLNEGIKDTAKTATTQAEKAAKSVTKTVKDLSQELEDLMVEGMADSLEKQVKQVRLAADRWIESMKEARDKDLENKDLYDSLIAEKERQTQERIRRIREEGYKQIAQNIKQIEEAYSDVIDESKSNPLAEFVARMKKSADDTKKRLDEINKQVEQTVKDSRSAIKDLQGELKQLLDDVGEDNIAKQFMKFGFTEEEAKRLAGEVKEKLDEAFLMNQPEIILSGKTAEDKLLKIGIDVKNLFGLIKNSFEDLDRVSFRSKYTEVLDKIEDRENDIAKAKEKIAGANIETLVTARKINQEYAKTAKYVQEQLMAQAESGTLGVIPDTFEVYIDFKIEDLETKLAEAKDKLGNIFDTDSDDYQNTKDKIDTINKELEKQYTILENIKKANIFAERELQINTGEGLGFFDSTDIMAQQLLIDKLQAQIDALNESKRQGMAIEQQVAEKESEYNEMREDYANNSMMWDEDEKKRSAEELERRKAEIEQLKMEMAALGYTGAEEMDKVIATLMAKMNKASKDMKNIWAQNANTILQSFQKVTSAFQDMISAIGEDNAELTNFLEAIGYINIMVNMAVGISEAVAAGAGQPFPYNLAAIASGVAAVMSAIGSAISLYKQNHKNVNSPQFAEGGVIGGRTARTKSEGRRDDVPIWASKGEYIINAETVKKYGIDFFDEINFGKKPNRANLTGRYADGGVVTQTVVQQANNQTIDYTAFVEALQQMPNPVVSVKEINSVQRRVDVAERIAKR